MKIKTIMLQCPKCGHGMEYWTRRDFINCVECGSKIEVEPCEDSVEVEEHIESEDEDLTKEIADINKFINIYNEKVTK